MKDDIVIPAWEIASTNTQIKIFNFFPALLSTIYLFLLVLYQVAWTYIYIFDLKDEFFSAVITFFHSSYFLSILGTIGFLALLFIFIVPLAQGGLIGMINHIDSRPSDEKPSFLFGITEGLKHFLPIFEASNFMAIFKLISIITFTIFLIRLFGIKYLGLILCTMGLFLCIAIVVNIFLAYTRFFIVLEGKKAMDAVVSSASMALNNLGITIHLYISLLLVYIRTVLTAIFFVVLPFLFSTIVTYFTTVSVRFLFLGIATILIGFLVFFVAHLNSVLEIFVETLWYRAYKDNKNRDSSDPAPHESSHHENAHADHH